MAAHNLLDGWRWELDNPTVLGWSVVSCYGLAAFSCVLRGRRALAFEPCGIWWLLAAGLSFLGVNKQLNFQTMMIVVGRNLAVSHGWYAHRRTAQLAFGAAFGALGLALSAWLILTQREFFLRHRLALAGVAILVGFVILRAATINHADQFFHVDLADASWAWILEVAGCVLIMVEAIRGLKSQERRTS